MENPDKSKIIKTVGSLAVLAFLGYNLFRAFKYFNYTKLDPYAYPIVKRNYRNLSKA